MIDLQSNAFCHGIAWQRSQEMSYEAYLQRVGVFENQFVKPTVESLETIEEGPGSKYTKSQLKSLRAKYTSTSITSLQSDFGDASRDSLSKKDEKEGVFVFKEGERLETFALYFSFAPEPTETAVLS